MKLVSSSHLHPLQVDNCDSNWRLVVNENDNDKFMLEGLILYNYISPSYSPAHTAVTHYFDGDPLTLTTLKYAYINHGYQRFFFNL